MAHRIRHAGSATERSRRRDLYKVQLRRLINHLDRV